ncbi:MAG: flavodoxin domain-containing protein [Candidatus Bathyarchaeia archaeon]|jgi:flavodoxin
MKALIVYDTASPLKMTAKVAETIGGVLKEKGIEVDSFFVKDVDRATVKSFDCLIAGSPTMYFRASREMRRFLNSFSDKEFSGKRGAAFDTQLQSRMSGNGAKGIEKKLKKLGFEVIAPPLLAYVEGKMNAIQLKEGELEKTKNWAQEVAKALSR